MNASTPRLAATIPCPTCDGSGRLDTAPLVTRLRAVSHPLGDDCWETRSTRPYAAVVSGTLRVAAHRLAHLLWIGPVDGHVLHHCDNARCWRPDHLYSGTAAQNNRDRRERATSYGRPGAANHFAKLGEAEVAAIRAAADHRGMLPRAVATKFAEQYGVHRNTVYKAFTGRTWRADTRVKPEPRPHWSKRTPPPEEK